MGSQNTAIAGNGEINMKPTLINYEGTVDQFWTALLMAIVKKYIPNGVFQITERELSDALSGKQELQVAKDADGTIHYRLVNKPEMFGKN